MKAVLFVVLLTASAFAGCASDRSAAVVTFKATYSGTDGTNFTVQLDGPRPFLDSDGQLRAGYALQTGQEGSFFGLRTQVLDSTLQVWRESGCWARVDTDETCGHLQTMWVNRSKPAYGVGGLLWGEPLEAEDGRFRVLAANEPDDVELFFYEYKAGNLWPERYVRSVPMFEHEETLWSLVDVEVGEPLEGAAARLVPTSPDLPAGQLFPGADQMFLPFEFTIAAGLQALKAASSEASGILVGGCVIDVDHRPRWTPEGPFPVNPLPAMFGNDVVDSMRFGLMDSAGAATSWQVDLRRDALGEESFTATKQEYTNMGPYLRCEDRIGAVVGPDEVLAHVPRDLLQGDYTSFTATWNPCCYNNGGGHLEYAASWFEDGQPHWRSIEVDASTGLYERFTYKPGDRIDPA